MKVETDNVFFMVVEFKKQIQELLERGLRSVNSKSSQERVKQITDMFAAMHPDKIQGPVPVEVPRETTFQWLAIETNWHKHRFDSKTVILVFEKISELKQKFDDLDRLTILINKR